MENVGANTKMFVIARYSIDFVSKTMVAGHIGQVAIIYRLNKEKILWLLPSVVTTDRLLLYTGAR